MYTINVLGGATKFGMHIILFPNISYMVHACDSGRLYKLQTYSFEYSFLKKAFLFSCHDKVVCVIFVVDNVFQINACLRI